MVGRHVAPHAVDVDALWAILTRMRKCDASKYHMEIAEVVASIAPAEKMRLYDTGAVPERLTTREVKELRHLIPDLYDESLRYPNYEGRFGSSAREIRTILLNAAHHDDYKCLNPLAVFEQIRELLGQTSVYDFLKQEAMPLA
jgi:serine protein kinase